MPTNDNNNNTKKDNNSKLDDYLKKVKKVDRSMSSIPEDESRPTDENTSISDSINEEKIHKDKQGIRDRWEMSRERSKQELEKARTIFKTQLNLLKHKADAAERESANFWNAKSAEVAETIKTYVQSSMRAIENNRMQAKNEAFIQAYEYSKTSLDKVCSMDLPERFKEDLIQRIHDELEITIDKITNESMADSYKLK